MSTGSTDSRIWLPKVFFMNWFDPETWKKYSMDATIWMPKTYHSEQEKQFVSNVITSAEKVIVGDEFRNVRDALIINKAIVQDAFNKSLVEKSFKKVTEERDEETSKALAEVAKYIEKSGDPASGALFDKFNEELNKPQPDKSRLKSFWTTIQNNLPSIASKSDSVTKIASLFA